jgi:hypothetical protein
MSPGGGVSVPAVAGLVAAGALAADDAGCGVDGPAVPPPPPPPPQPLAQSPTAASTASPLVPMIALALPMAGCYEAADLRRRCAR